MANINIYGTLFSNLSELNDKVIVLGSQVYGNKPDQSSTATPIYTDTQDWTSGLVMGNQYDINRFFKAEIDNISTNYVPYTGAGKDVNLGSHTITSGSITASGRVSSSAGFYLTNKTGANISSIDANSDVYLLTNYGGGYNCLKLAKLYTEITFISGGSGGKTLIGHLNNLYNKVNHITQPLRFKGVINTGGKLPDLNEGVEVGDVWHFNADVTPYYGGDEVVCTAVSSKSITWELLGQNITPIPTSNITIQNLES